MTYMVNIEKIEVDISKSGHITNAYVIYDDNKNAVLIDPGDEADVLIYKIKNMDLNVSKIIITHGHGDHIGALEKLQLFTHAKVICHTIEKDKVLCKVENYSDMLGISVYPIKEECIELVNEGDIVQVGEMKFEIIHTPGHSNGSICIYEQNSNILITGDTIFADCYGRCDLETSDFSDMVKSLRKMFEKFSDITIYPGHGHSVNINIAKKKIKYLVAMKGKII